MAGHGTDGLFVAPHKFVSYRKADMYAIATTAYDLSDAMPR
jgi:hypothetical protein